MQAEEKQREQMEQLKIGLAYLVAFPDLSALPSMPPGHFAMVYNAAVNKKAVLDCLPRMKYSDEALIMVAEGSDQYYTGEKLRVAIQAEFANLNLSFERWKYLYKRLGSMHNTHPLGKFMMQKMDALGTMQQWLEAANETPEDTYNIGWRLRESFAKLFNQKHSWKECEDFWDESFPDNFKLLILKKMAAVARSYEDGHELLLLLKKNQATDDEKKEIINTVHLLMLQCAPDAEKWKIHWKDASHIRSSDTGQHRDLLQTSLNNRWVLTYQEWRDIWSDTVGSWGKEILAVIAEKMFRTAKSFDEYLDLRSRIQNYRDPFKKLVRDIENQLRKTAVTLDQKIAFARWLDMKQKESLCDDFERAKPSPPQLAEMAGFAFPKTRMDKVVANHILRAKELSLPEILAICNAVSGDRLMQELGPADWPSKKGLTFYVAMDLLRNQELPFKEWLSVYIEKEGSYEEVKEVALTKMQDLHAQGVGGQHLPDPNRSSPFPVTDLHRPNVE